MLLAARNDPLPIILVDLVLFSRPALSAGAIPRRVITDERVGKDQSATNERVRRVWKSESQREDDATNCVRARTGVDKKSGGLRVRDTHIRAGGGEPIDGFGRNTRRLSSRVSAHGCRLNLRPRKKTKKAPAERGVDAYLYPAL